MAALRVACLQIQPRADQTPADHFEEVAQQVRGAGDADLIVLPELWNVGYFAFDQYRDEAEPADGPTARRLSALAREVGSVLHGGSFVERADAALHNTSVVFGPDGATLARYRKVHVFGYQSRERQLVTGGDVLSTFPLGGAQAGLAICYDLRFPELFRAAVDDVALFVVPATWPAARVGHWQALLRARAIENQAFVVGCNAAGRNGGVELGGASAIIDPWGEAVAQAGPGPTVLEAAIDLSAPSRARSDFPALRDRVLPRPTLAGAITSEAGVPS
ncbi:MAG: carbon-nitrogen family hydrolase [Nitriliruptorales bacterium]|nr:carbon-nitrogen family hydrolase [Nitriliruptorales bacterium]